MRIISWNVNGIRATSGKIKNGEKTGSSTDNVIKTLIKEQKPDILCFQEVKTQNPSDLDIFKSDYKYILNNFSKSKKGYSGVTLMTNKRPQWVSHDFGLYSEDEIGNYSDYEFIHEGRILTVKFDNMIVIVTYVPNSQPKLARINMRIEWERILRNYLNMLKEKMSVPVIMVGDLNVAPKEIDIHDPKGKNKVAGFSPEERNEFQNLLGCGLVDSFRHKYPTTVKYTYYSNFANAREKGLGWRIDMAMISDFIKSKIIEADCLNEYYGSDHVPILLDIDI
jgi:exodeoxyribonuclease-3